MKLLSFEKTKDLLKKHNINIKDTEIFNQKKRCN